MTESKSKIIEGRITLTSKGDGYVKIDEVNADTENDFNEGESIFVDHSHLNCAFHGDKVEIEILGKQKNERTGEDTFYGVVLKILERTKVMHAGRLEEDHGMFFLIPDDKKTYTDFIIHKSDAMNAEAGDKVVAEIIN
jgi:ribonuclease R